MSDLDLISFRLLIDRVVVPVRHHFRRVFLPIALPLVACSLLVTLVQVEWLKAFMGSSDAAAVLPLMGGVLVLGVAVIMSYGLGFAALTVASLDALAGRPVAMGRAWLFTLKPVVLGTLIVVGMANVLSLMMCLFPALYVIPVLSFVVPAMVEEGLYGWAAIRRSAQLVHFNPTGRLTDGGWLQVLVLLLVGMVINYAVTLTVQLPFIIAQQVVMFRDAAAGQTTDAVELLTGSLGLQVAAQILGAFATAATWLYWTFGISLLYRELRRRKEGDDLRAAIDELTGEVTS